MIRTASTSTPVILSRFHQFDDAVVRGVQLVTGPLRRDRKATITLEARDMSSDADDGWVQVVLRVSEVTEYRFVDNGRESYYVLSLGLKVGEFDKTYYFDFGPDTDEPDSVDDFRGSRFYVAGRGYSWEVKPYPKSWKRRQPHDPSTNGGAGPG